MKRAVGRYGGRAVSGLARGVGHAAAALVLLTALPPYRLTALKAQVPARRYENTAPRIAPSVTSDSVARLEYPQGVQDHARTTDRDDAEIVKAIEHRIRCTCGCNLDVFTCRTTDFTCATSPAMHRLVLARLDSSMTAEQVVAAFEAQYGQAILMQPPKRGFNWTAYLMPFIGLGIGIGLLGMAMRRLVAKHAAETAAADPQAPAVDTVNPEELERLKAELERFES